MRPQDIKTTALFTIEGELDDISGAGQTKAAHELCTGIPKERQFHYDVEGRRPLRHLLAAAAGARWSTREVRDLHRVQAREPQARRCQPPRKVQAGAARRRAQPRAPRCRPRAPIIGRVTARIHLP